MDHTLDLRVYYEDTDLAGIVYYANYLKFIERGRTEWLRGLGVDQSVLQQQTGQVFAVRRVEADYLRPARLDDRLQVRTAMIEARAARITMAQQVFRGDQLLFQAQVTIVCLAADGRPARIPAMIRALLGGGG